nr:hypothetical protein [Nanoarchaeota archaeon]
MKKIMRSLTAEIPTETRDISMTVMSLEPNDSLTSKAVFITPYKKNCLLSNREDVERINVTHLEMLPSVHYDKTKKYSLSSFCLRIEKKDFKVVSKNDLKKQVDGYLTLLTITKKPGADPASVVMIHDAHCMPVREVVTQSVSQYAQTFMEEKFSPEFVEKAVKEGAKIRYNPFTFKGLRRRIKNIKQVIYWPPSDHPGRKEIVANPKAFGLKRLNNLALVYRK